MKSLLLAATVLLALPLPSARAAGDGIPPARGDSLRTLRITITSELEGKGKVLILKDPTFSDSLLGFRLRGDRRRFDQLLGDSSLATVISTQEEFRAYWRKVEAEAGITDLRGRQAAQDLDRSRVPRIFLFDSSVVIYPGIVVLRRKREPVKRGR